LLPRQRKLLTAATNKHDQATKFNSGDRGDNQAEECAVVQLRRYTNFNIKLYPREHKPARGRFWLP